MKEIMIGHGIKTLAVSAALCALVVGCSDESRDAAIERMSNAAKELNGGEPDGTPRVVKEARAKEARRQNTKWTPENKSKYSLEYCREALEQLDKHEKSLKAVQLKLNIEEQKCQTQHKRLQTLKTKLDDLFPRLKQAYKNAEATNQWPIVLGTLRYDKESARTAILEWKDKIDSLPSELSQVEVNRKRLQQRGRQVREELINLGKTREKIRLTISTLETKQIASGTSSVADSVKDIDASLNAIDKVINDSTIDDVMMFETDAKFDAIMAE